MSVAALVVGELLPHHPLVLPQAVPGLSEVSAGVSTDPLWVQQVFSLQLRPLATCHRRQQISLGGEALLRLRKDLLTKVSVQAGYSSSTREALVIWWSVSVWLGRYWANCWTQNPVRFSSQRQTANTLLVSVFSKVYTCTVCSV